MSAKRTRSIKTVITSSDNNVKVINVITDVYDGSISDVMESIKFSIRELSEETDESTSEEVEIETKTIKKYQNIDIDDLFTKMLTDLINAMPENRKFVGISELTQAINEIISNTTDPTQYSFKLSNMLLSMNSNYIKSIKEIFKSDVSSKMLTMLFPLTNHEIFKKCRCRRNIDGLKDKWIIKFK